MNELISLFVGKVFGVNPFHHEAYILFFILAILGGLFFLTLTGIYTILRLRTVTDKVSKLKMCFVTYKENVLKDQIKELKMKLRRRKKEGK